MLARSGNSGVVVCVIPHVTWGFLVLLGGSFVVCCEISVRSVGPGLYYVLLGEGTRACSTVLWEAHPS